jgi:hypothetical protein
MIMLATTQSALAAPLGRRAILPFLVRFRRLLNRWVAAAIALQERRAALAALRLLDDREKDIGLCRD